MAMKRGWFVQRPGIALAVVNPRPVRDFAHGIGMDAKTDRIDARVISRFGEVVGPALMAIASICLTTPLHKTTKKYSNDDFPSHA